MRGIRTLRKEERGLGERALAAIEHWQMVEDKYSERAKRWFDRPAYLVNGYCFWKKDEGQ